MSQGEHPQRSSGVGPVYDSMDVECFLPHLIN